ncbi:Transcription elongation factor spt6, partial [Dipsacomyces acuminosporus]
MSDIEEYDDGSPRHSRRNLYEEEDEDEGSDTYGSRRRYDDDDDEEDDDEDDNDDELRRDGFVVDDDEIEEQVSEDESRRRKKKKKKKKKRRHAEREGAQADDDDILDEEDLALVAENTNQGSYTPSSGSRFKRLKRGTARKTIHDDDDADDLRAELNDLVDDGGDEDRDLPRDRYRRRDDGYSDEEDDRPRGGYDDLSMDRRQNEYDDDLGLFGNDDEEDRLPEDDFRSSRRRDRGRGDRGDAGVDDDLRGRSARREGYEDDELGDARASTGQREGAMGGYFDTLEGVDEDTWMELQDIFGNGEEYAFAMEAMQDDQGTYKQKTLADVFEPAELEAKMLTQRDEDIRTTDIPERMLMRARGSDALRSLSEDEIEEETTWVVRQLHSWLVRQADIKSRTNDASGSSNAWGAEDQSAFGHEQGSEQAAEIPSLFKHADFMNERFLAAILSVLKLLSQDFYEVPYIARHRREVFVTPISADGKPSASTDDQGEEVPTREWLSNDDLWKLYDFDEQFRGFLACRRHLENMLRRLKGEGIDEANEDGAPAESAISAEDQKYVAELIASASRVEDITDITDWLQMHYSAVIRSWKQQRAEFKRPRSLGLWEQAKREGLDKFIDKVGITARQVGENINSPGSHAVAEHEPMVRPSDAAQEFVGTNFVNTDVVLRAGKSVLAHTLAADPQIRRFVREYCEKNASVVTRPTDRGLREITHEEHPAFAIKFLRQKPVAEFANSAQFLVIEKSLQDGLIRMEFSLTNEYKFDNRNWRHDDEVFDADKERTAQVLSTQIDKHIQSDAMHEAAEAWNKLRREAVFTAVYEHLLPQMWRETTQKLHQQAFEFVSDSCRRALERRISVQPARNSRMLPGEKPRVVVVAGGGFDASSRGSLRIVYVNEHGKFVEYFTADSMRRSGGFDDSAPSGDGIAPLLDLLSHQTIEVVAVAGMTLQTKRLFEDVQEAVNDHCSRSGDDIVVTYANDEVARLWWDCEQAREEFPGLRKEERYCVSVARTLQDPALEYASLGRGILNLALHPAQRDVDQDVLFTIVERAFVNVINKVGVDINELAVYPHKQCALQYVSGLGPRKAQGIINKIGPGEKMLEARSDLVVKRLCTRTVFINCASFLRIRPAAMDILDDTRIHPEDYDLARKMALDALDIEDDDDDDEDSSGRRGRKKADGPSRYVTEVMRRSPEKLDELDLVKYAEELKRLLDVHKLETLKFIKHEMQHPNDDPREEFKQPTDKEVLAMLTGEVVGNTLKEDGTCLVAGTIVRVQPRFAIAKLDSGIEGFINIANVSDKMIDKVSDELAPGQAIVGVVKRIDLEKMSLDLSIKQSEVGAVRESAQQL